MIIVVITAATAPMVRKVVEDVVDGDRDTIGRIAFARGTSGGRHPCCGVLCEREVVCRLGTNSNGHAAPSFFPGKMPSSTSCRDDVAIRV